MNDENESNQRQAFLSYPSFQMAIVGTHLLSISVILGLSFLEISDKKLLIFMSLSVFCISSSILLVVTHRLVGPISRLMGILSSLATGEDIKSPVTVRKKDYLKELPIVVEKIAQLLKNSKNNAKAEQPETNAEHLIKKKAA